jgi:cobalt-zinc-cadmium efflux system membrane fusion protein
MKKYIILLAIAAAAAACGTKNTEPAAEPAAAKEIHERISLSAEQFKQAGIQTGTFTFRTMQEYIPAAAELYLGAEHTASVGTITEGIVSELRVTLNQSLRKGDVVAVLNKPGLLDWQQEYLERKDRIAFLKTEFERYKSLSADNATAGKNLQKAEADLREAQTAQALLAAKLRQYQIDPESVAISNLKTQILLRAPKSGTVTKINAGVGASLAPGASLVEMADYSRIQPVVYVFEKDIHRVKVGARVLLFFAADPTRTFPAVITGMDGEVDRERRALRAFARFEQSPDKLAAGAYMDAKIAPSAGSETAALPEAAVVRESDGQYIFILEREVADGAVFHKVAVQTGAVEAGFVAVTPLEPLPKDAKIVLQGAYYVSAQGAGIELEE